MVNSHTNEEVPPAEIRKGFEVAPGEYVLVKPEDLTALRPKESRDIEVVQIVKAGTLAPQWFSRPYYLGPDRSSDAYFALAKALAEENVEGIASWTMRGQQYIGHIYPLAEAIQSGTGKVQVGDTVWLVNGGDAPVGARVRVIGVRGAVLQVENVG
jgi:non-homologous end joining protein Ku